MKLFKKDKNGKWHKRFSKAYKTKLDVMNAEREFLVKLNLLEIWI